MLGVRAFSQHEYLSLVVLTGRFLNTFQLISRSDINVGILMH